MDKTNKIKRFSLRKHLSLVVISSEARKLLMLCNQVKKILHMRPE